MFVQNSVNKKITLQTLLSQITSPVVFNANKTGISLTVNGSNQANLFYVDGSSNRIGVLTNNPDSTFQVVGDIKVGGSLISEKTISTLVVGEPSGGKKVITVTTSDNHNFTSTDRVNIQGFTPIELTGLKDISVTGNTTFTYEILDSVNTETVSSPGASSKAIRTTYFPGIYKDSVEEILLTSNQASSIYPVTASYSITNINIKTTITCSLSSLGATGQSKTLVLNSSQVSSDKVIFSNVNGLGFNKIQLVKVGDSVTLKFNGEKWVIIGIYGAIISTV